MPLLGWFTRRSELSQLNILNVFVTALIKVIEKPTEDPGWVNYVRGWTLAILLLFLLFSPISLAKLRQECNTVLSMMSLPKKEKTKRLVSQMEHKMVFVRERSGRGREGGSVRNGYVYVDYYVSGRKRVVIRGLEKIGKLQAIAPLLSNYLGQRVFIQYYPHQFLWMKERVGEFRREAEAIYGLVRYFGWMPGEYPNVIVGRSMPHVEPVAPSSNTLAQRNAKQPSSHNWIVEIMKKLSSYQQMDDIPKEYVEKVSMFLFDTPLPPPGYERLIVKYREMTNALSKRTSAPKFTEREQRIIRDLSKIFKEIKGFEAHAGVRMGYVEGISNLIDMLIALITETTNS